MSLTTMLRSLVIAFVLNIAIVVGATLSPLYH